MVRRHGRCRRRRETLAEAVSRTAIRKVREGGESQVPRSRFGVAQLRTAQLLLTRRQRNSRRMARPAAGPGAASSRPAPIRRPARPCPRRACAGACHAHRPAPRPATRGRRPSADRARAGEELLDGLLDGGIEEWPDRDRLGRRVEVTNVRRAHHDIGQKARQRQGFEVCGATLPGDRGSRDPAATAVEIEDDLARLGPRLDLGGDVGDRGRRSESVEDRQQ